jgi:hypothetical protein
MPHTPEHNRQYTIAGTGEKYTGKVVEIGGQFYTTEGGAFEGHSQQLQESLTSTDVINPPPQPIAANNTIRGRSGMSRQQMTGGTPTPPRGNTNAQTNPVVATFVRGDGSENDRTYYLPLNYRGDYGAAGSPVKNGTPLHRHQNRQTMLEHNMDNPVVVTTARPATPMNNGARSSSRLNNQRMTSGGTRRTTQRMTGGGTRRTSGGGGGGY